MRHSPLTVLMLGLSLTLGHGAIPGAVLGQQPDGEVRVAEEDLVSFARSYTEINAVRDEIHAELAATTNKSESAQARLRERMINEVASVLESHGLTQEEFDRITFAVSIDPDHRERFQAILARLAEDSE